MHETFQQKGSGSAALKLVEKEIDELVMLVHFKADWAKRFYSKNGYQIIGETKNEILSYKDGLLKKFYLDNTVLMSKLLKVSENSY